MLPKVSIIIPCYNSEKWIEECVVSALNQTYERTEVIVVDNESKDKSLEILEKIRKSNNELLLSTAENIYPNCWDEARTEGYKMMTGDYMTVIGSDDHIEQNYIKNCVNIVMKAPDRIKALQSPAQGFAIKNGTKVQTGKLRHTYKSKKEFMNESLQRCPVNSPTVFYNSSLYADGLLETYPEKYGGAADYDLYCRLIDNDIFIYPYPEWIGFNYRWHEEQATWKVHKEGANYDKMIQDHWREKWKDKL
tara:strand:+ start:722 stop:1468 length:747 start_codon:yes stop_codon:yes gene_type:complete